MAEQVVKEILAGHDQARETAAPDDDPEDEGAGYPVALPPRDGGRATGRRPADPAPSPDS
ncbi:hypothetical protein SAMN05421833_10731 [Microbispora rosea]|uniref:Uncharacterized protein n=1 Tax=Microbispora rosea TaxID=58117 RepID=A0A1N6Z846_9ACTN|nr:hypothetical protein [Microbispora rosea]GIH47556.1 hypothetical protein Mro03_27350 [Microbispora rosea subsp. rosea]SIR22973.1 hypothetical protein SAMN05421833_10731 [Microbispora rosea]